MTAIDVLRNLADALRMGRVLLFLMAGLISATPAPAQNKAKSGAVQQPSLDALIAKRGFGPTYEWNDYGRLYSLTERGSELLKGNDFASTVDLLGKERNFAPDRLRPALRNFLSFALADRPRASYAALIRSAQSLGDSELGAQMAAVALYKMKESNCARGDMTAILKAFELSATQAWIIVDELICLNARVDFLDHFPAVSRAVALRSFGYGGMSRADKAAFDEWRVQPENLALIISDGRPELAAEWRREHIASLLQFGLTDEAAHYYQSLDATDRKSLYALGDGLYRADVGGLRERTFSFDQIGRTAEAAVAFRLGGHADVADDIAEHGIGNRVDRNWACVVEQVREQCEAKAPQSARVLLLLMRYFADKETADPYYLVEATAGGSSSGRLQEGEAYGIPYSFCTRIKDARYRSMCAGAEPLGSWASKPPDSLRADAARLNAAILKRHPDILAAKPKYEEAQRSLAQLAKAAQPIDAAIPASTGRIDAKLIDAFRNSGPTLGRLERNELERLVIVNRAGDRALVNWGDEGGGASYRAIRAPDGSWSVTMISSWIVD